MIFLPIRGTFRELYAYLARKASGPQRYARCAVPDSRGNAIVGGGGGGGGRALIPSYCVKTPA